MLHLNLQERNFCIKGNTWFVGGFIFRGETKERQSSDKTEGRPIKCDSYWCTKQQQPHRRHQNFHLCRKNRQHKGVLRHCPDPEPSGADTWGGASGKMLKKGTLPAQVNYGWRNRKKKMLRLLVKAEASIITYFTPSCVNPISCSGQHSRLADLILSAQMLFPQIRYRNSPNLT